MVSHFIIINSYEEKEKVKVDANHNYFVSILHSTQEKQKIHAGREDWRENKTLRYGAGKSISAGNFSKFEKWTFWVMGPSNVRFLSSTRGERCQKNWG